MQSANTPGAVNVRKFGLRYAPSKGCPVGANPPFEFSEMSPPDPATAPAAQALPFVINLRVSARVHVFVHVPAPDRDAHTPAALQKLVPLKKKLISVPT